MKETLFDLLQTRIQGCRFLDCFAGSGSVGIEALSRGAAFVGFVESSAAAGRVIHQNLEALGIEPSDRWQILKQDVEIALRNLHGAGKKFDIVFLDPPYAGAAQYPKVFDQLQRLELLSETALVIAEHSKFVKLPDSVPGCAPLGSVAARLERFRDVRQGDSVLSLFQLRI